MTLNPSLIEETLRLYHRYQVEVVERFNLCPWAKAAHTSGNAVPLVFEHAAQPLLTALNQATQLSADIVLLIFPDYQGRRAPFEQLVAELIREDGLRCDLSSPVFAMAAFHPEGSVKTTSAEDLIPYLRSSPDPTIQLVRITALERARKNEPPGTQFVDPAQLDLATMLRDLHAKKASSAKGTDGASLRQRVATANYDMWNSDGHLLRQTVKHILDDRRRVHEHFGLGPSPWESPNTREWGVQS